MRSNTVEVANVAGHSARTNNDPFNGPMDYCPRHHLPPERDLSLSARLRHSAVYRVPGVTTKRY